MWVAGTGCRGWLPGGVPDHLGEVTNRDKNRAVRAYARATGVPRHLLCNPDIFFVVLGYRYGIPANPLGTPALLTRALTKIIWGLQRISREPIGGAGGYMGVSPAGSTPVYSQISHLSTLFVIFGHF